MNLKKIEDRSFGISLIISIINLLLSGTRALMQHWEVSPLFHAYAIIALMSGVVLLATQILRNERGELEEDIPGAISVTLIALVSAVVAMLWIT